MNVPKLRFKKFADEWQPYKLSDIGNFLKGGNLNKSNLSLDGIPCILYGELYTFYNEFATKIKSKTFITPDLVLSKKYDILLPLSGETAEDISTCTCVLFDNVALGGDLLIFRSSFTNNLFMSLLLKYKYKYKIARIAQGKSIVHINIKSLKNIKVNLPSLEEQNKLSSFLFIVNKKIENLENTITSLENQKKGLLQQVFNQKLRFKDKNGNNYPNWEKKKITDIAITYIGLVTTMTKFYVEKGIPLIRNSDIKENKFIFNEQIFLDEKFAKNNSSRQHKLNDIITVHTGDVGTSAMIDENLVNSIGFATIVTRIKDFNKYNPKYICWYLNSPICKSKIYTMITGDGRNNLNMKDFNKLYIPTPCFEEQTKIADFLSAFDRKIDNQKAQLEHWQQIKKGLLQQMFV